MTPTRAVNRNRTLDYPQEPDVWTCDLCGGVIPRGYGPHVRIRGFGTDCITYRIHYTLGPDGEPARDHRGLPVASRVEFGWA